jgi:hypothetical protein
MTAVSGVIHELMTTFWHPGEIARQLWRAVGTVRRY